MSYKDASLQQEYNMEDMKYRILAADLKGRFMI